MRRIFALSVLTSLLATVSGLATEIAGSVSPKKTYSIVGHAAGEGKGEEFSIKDNKSSSNLGTIYKDQIDLGLIPTRVVAKWSKDETKLLVIVEYLKTAEVYCVERKDDGKFAAAQCDGISPTAMIADVNREDFGVKNADGFRGDTTSCVAGHWVDSSIPVYEVLGLSDGNGSVKRFGLSFLIQYSTKGFAVSKVVKRGEVSDKRKTITLEELKIR